MRKKSNGILKMILGLFFVGAAFFADTLLFYIYPGVVDIKPVLLGDALAFAIRALIAIVGMFLLGGGEWFKLHKGSIKKTWKFARFPLLVNGGLGILFFVSALFGEELNPNLVQDFLLITLVCFLVGLNEEAIFRGLCFGSFLAGFGKKKGGVLAAAILSSAAFGFAHVYGSIDYFNGAAILSGIMKTLQTGLFGLILCWCAYENNDLWGPISANFFFDWILMISNAVTGESPEVDYVVSDWSTAIFQCAFFGIVCLVELPAAIKAAKNLAKVRGGKPFLKD